MPTKVYRNIIHYGALNIKDNLDVDAVILSPTGDTYIVHNVTIGSKISQGATLTVDGNMAVTSIPASTSNNVLVTNAGVVSQRTFAALLAANGGGSSSPTVNKYTTSQTLVGISFNSFDATAGALVATLPTAVGIAGQVITVRKLDTTANTITMASTLSQTINESAASTVILKGQGWSLDFMSDGENWVII